MPQRMKIIGGSWPSFEWSLTWSVCVHAAAVSIGGRSRGDSRQLRQLQLYRHEMHHFVRALHEYIANEVVTVSWHEFETGLGQDLAGVDDLRQRHLSYLHKCCFRSELCACDCQLFTMLFYDAWQSLWYVTMLASTVTSHSYCLNQGVQNCVSFVRNCKISSLGRLKPVFGFVIQFWDSHNCVQDRLHLLKAKITFIC